MTRAEKNLTGLTMKFEGMTVHKHYLCELDLDDFTSGMIALAETFKMMYAGMINDPQKYAMKGADDVKGLVKNMNFLLLMARMGVLNNTSLEVDGKKLAPALKEAKVTKPEIYFRIIEPLGFTASGLGKKIAESGKITIDFPDNKFCLTALKAMADAVSVFSTINPNQGNYYFQFLDHRALESHPATEPKNTMEYILSKLKTESQDVVEIFYEFIKPLTKCEIKGDIGWYWTPTFTLKSTKKVILSFKLTLDNHNIKLNLANIGQYTELLDGYPTKITEEMKSSGWGCGNCNSKCVGAFVFDLDGINYKKCRCGSFVFDNPSKDDSELLLGLLKKELEIS